MPEQEFQKTNRRILYESLLNLYPAINNRTLTLTLQKGIFHVNSRFSKSTDDTLINSTGILLKKKKKDDSAENRLR